MASTAISDIVNPEVLADQIAAKFPDELVFGNLPIINQSTNFPIGSPGTTFTLPFFKRIGALAALVEGTPMVPGTITTGKENSVVQRAGIAESIYDTAELVSIPSVLDEVVSQLSRRTAEYVDSALVTAVEKTPNVKDYSATGAGTMDDVAIADALYTLGDNHQRLLASGAFIMHSKVYFDLVKLGKIQNDYQSGIGTLRTGKVPFFMGLPIYISDRCTTAVVSSVTQYNSYIVGPGALELFYQRQMMVEFDRDILLRATVVAASIDFVTHLNGWDDVSNTQAAQDAKSILAVRLRTK